MRKVRARLGLAAAGAYLASVGTILALLVAGEFPAWLDGESPWGLSTSLVVGVVAAVAGVCLVVAAVVEGSGTAERRDGSSVAASPGAGGALDRGSDPDRATYAVGDGAPRTAVRESRGSDAIGRAGLSGETPARSEVTPAGLGSPATSSEAVPCAEAPDGKCREGPSRAERTDHADAGRSSGAPCSPVVLDPSTLIGCWRRYRDEGDGHFRADGLREELTECGFALEVIEGRDLGAGDDVLIVPTGAPGGACFLVPSFAKAPDAVGRWFDDRGDRSLSRRVNRITEVAEGRRTADGIELVRKGAVS